MLYCCRSISSFSLSPLSLLLLPPPSLFVRCSLAHSLPPPSLMTQCYWLISLSSPSSLPSISPALPLSPSPWYTLARHIIYQCCIKLFASRYKPWYRSDRPCFQVLQYLLPEVIICLGPPILVLTYRFLLSAQVFVVHKHCCFLQYSNVNTL